jgi:hypothetical protein
MDSIFKINLSPKMSWRYRKEKPDFCCLYCEHGLGAFPFLYGILEYSKENGWYFKLSPFRKSYIDPRCKESIVKFDLANDILIKGKDMNECYSILMKYISLGNLINTNTDPLLFLDRSIFKQRNIDNEETFKKLINSDSPPVRINSFEVFDDCEYFININNTLMCGKCVTKKCQNPKKDFTNFCVLGSYEAYNLFSDVSGENCDCPITIINKV